MLERILEPEVMDTREEAIAYDTMDHSEVNATFVSDLLVAAKRLVDEYATVRSATPVPTSAHAIWLEALDVGTGTALQPIALCQACALIRVVAIDAADEMLRLARMNVEIASLSDRLLLKLCDAKELPFEDQRFSIVMSNSIVHHIPNPFDVLREMVRVAAPGGQIFVRDLLRPADEATINYLVETYAAEADPYQRELFANSLHAALTLEEIQEMVVNLGFEASSVQATSDRHWTWSSEKYL